MRTNVGHVFAIGDVVGEPMLAHKATHEAKVAAEVIAGHNVRSDARSIPNVAYTDPEIAWTGLTETRARAEGIAYEKAMFPWAASGRSLAQGRDDGLTKLLVEPETRRVLGAGIVGPNAGELIAEAVHAIEVGLRRPGHRPDDPPASDAVGDPWPGRRTGRRHRSRISCRLAPGVRARRRRPSGHARTAHEDRGHARPGHGRPGGARPHGRRGRRLRAAQLLARRRPTISAPRRRGARARPGAPGGRWACSSICRGRSCGCRRGAASGR